MKNDKTLADLAKEKEGKGVYRYERGEYMAALKAHGPEPEKTRLNRREIVAMLAAASAKLLAASEKARAKVSPQDIAAIQLQAEAALQFLAKEEQCKYGWYDEDGVRQGGLIAFVRYFWPVLEPSTPFVDGWVLWAVCEHLEAVTRGDIKRLLINVPPGCMKSMLVNIFWPAWEWGPMGKAHYRYVTFSYSAHLTERDNGRFRDLITSPIYQRLYGSGDQGVQIRNKTTLKVHNTATGWKLASSVGGVGTGERGERLLIDDPHNVKDVESETVRTETTRWFRESLSSRFTSEETAFIVIMQRVHEDDVSGVILSNNMAYCHLMVPMLYDWERQTDEENEPRATAIGWTDPRYSPEQNECDGELAWPQRFSQETCDQLQVDLGPYAWAGQYLQAPAPRGGGLFKTEWWQLWPDDKKFFYEDFDFILASLDGAFTEDEENDPSALTVWGVYLDEQKRRRILLLEAWQKWLRFSAPRVDRLHEPTVIDGKMWPADYVHPEMAESIKAERNRTYRARCQANWGLVEHVADTCRRRRVNTLIIEGQASGISAAQEIAGRYSGMEPWSVVVLPAKGDKVARALAAQPVFSQLMVYAPDREWAQQVIDQMGTFPKAKHDDLTDSTCQAINYLRAMGLASSDVETTAAVESAVRHRAKKMKPIYPV